MVTHLAVAYPIHPFWLILLLKQVCAPTAPHIYYIYLEVQQETIRILEVQQLASPKHTRTGSSGSYQGQMSHSRQLVNIGWEFCVEKLQYCGALQSVVWVDQAELRD